jgi:G3E family GTPase
VQGSARIPVTLVTGFLGSGKTTLINRLLRAAAFADSAVLVNEFGAIGIDHLLVETARDNIVLLESGCLCCVLADSLRETLADLFRRRARGEVPPFRRVLIETSGLADPAPILQALMKDPLVAPMYASAGVICVVEAGLAEQQLADNVEARTQLALADRLVVSKLAAGEEPAATLRATLAAVNPLAPCMPAGKELELLAAFCAEVQLVSVAREFAPARHGSDVQSFCFTYERSVSWAGIAAWTAHLGARFGDDLLRCKALLRLHGKPGFVVVQGVRRSFETRYDAAIEAVGRAGANDAAAGGSPIVCIGRRLDRAALRAGLAWLDAPEGVACAAGAQYAPWARPGAAA